MKIWRGIFLNNLDELDITNFGVHWTKDYNYPSSAEFRFNVISDNERKGRILYVFEAEIDLAFIDKKSTRISNKNYPSESECVLKTNILIDKIELIDNIELKKYTNVNTGSRVSDWMKSRNQLQISKLKFIIKITEQWKKIFTTSMLIFY